MSSIKRIKLKYFENIRNINRTKKTFDIKSKPL